MHEDKIYDVAIIGGGVSSSVFVSSFINNGFNGKVAIIENGRNLGGRSSTRYSFRNNGWQLNHGSPNFNICNSTNNELIKNFINELLDSQIILPDPSESMELGEEGRINSKINSDFHRGSNYMPRSTMAELSQDIISLKNLRNQIDYFFETLIVKLDFKNERWKLTSKDGKEFSCKFLVCSSNLILHKRCLEILKLKQTPLRKAIPIKMDKKFDKIVNLLKRQHYIKRLTFLIYTNSNYSYKDDYKFSNRYFFLSNLLEEKFKFERVIFQKQSNNKLGIVVHIRNIDFINDYFQIKNKEILKNKLLLKFNEIFADNKYINELLDYKDISTMIWRASQPSGLGIPENLQVCEKLNLAFCGDWFDMPGFGRIEGAIFSALKLSYKINSLF